MKVGYKTQVDDEFKSIQLPNDDSSPILISVAQTKDNNMENKFLVWHIEGGLGKNIAATALIPSIVKKYKRKEGYENSPLFNPTITMAKAYQKAILLDDDLIAQRDEELLERAKAKRAAEIEKAKKLKKFTGRSPSAGVKPASSKDALSSIYDSWASGSL